MNKKNKLVLGLTGPNASGKGEICNYLIKKGFVSMSLSDILRKEAKRRKMLPARNNLIFLGNFLRAKYGGNILAKRLSKKILKQVHSDKIVVDSIRTIGEIEEFEKIFGDRFILIHITAPLRLRYKFIKKRNRVGDPRSYMEFLSTEKKECSKSIVKQQIHKCKQKANFFVSNNSTLSVLRTKIDKILNKINKFNKK